MTKDQQSKARCGHIYANLTMCQKKDGYSYSSHCKLHFNDINCDRKSSKIQIQRLIKLRKIIAQLREKSYSLDI